MKILEKISHDLKSLGNNFTIEVLAKDLQPKITEILKNHQKDRQRKSKLSPLLTVWLILVLPLRRELSYPNVLGWLLSGLRALGWDLPRCDVEEGAISHARKRIGVGVLRDLFHATWDISSKVAADFHGLISLAVDGTSLTMPDTPGNVKAFGKHKGGRGKSGYPQMRVVALVSTVTQAVFDLAWGPYSGKGKGTGERSLTASLLLKHARKGFLFLLDRGLYSFSLFHQLLEKQTDFLVRVPAHVGLRKIRKSQQPDGSYFAWMTGKVEVPQASPAGQRKKWGKARHQVRVIEYQVPGFRKIRLSTSLLDLNITARELVDRYHKRWEIELAYDQIKTHQSARRTGQCPAIFRSKRPDLVEQELFAMMALYNLVKDLINQAAAKHQINPLAISFVDALQAIIDAIPGMQRAKTARLKFLYEQLLDDIAGCRMSRWRRKRAYPRVVKIKMSKFKLKRKPHKEIFRDFQTDTRIIGENL